MNLLIFCPVLESIDLFKDPDLKRDLEAIKSAYPSVQDFERDFPSICFALATGVGKTRLMGAFISYLYLTGRSRNFFVLAPNLTIYEKLKEDFSPQSSKYVFRGIQEFHANAPVITTGEDYADSKGVRFDEVSSRGTGRLFHDSEAAYINIFNISKINATENTKGAAKSKTPRIKRLQETIGESYFEYLSNRPDLVILMDEAHRYRASAGANAINELKPVLGIELTATPKTTGATAVDFKNTIYAYSLSEAMEDGYVKDPAVATRKDFIPENYTAAQLELIKLEDGVRHHEYVKVELKFYADQYDKKLVKPFMLVVAQDTAHARQLHKLLESDTFFEGSYKGKIAEVHSRQSGTEEDANIQRLISIEDPNEPTEIVIHVNKLKEGWDVTNLYTIVPLRASASEILTEQTIGRGLRLPYGRRTGVEAVDRLTIIAHDKFQDILDRANDPNSIIKKKIEIGNDGDIPIEAPQVISVPPIATQSWTGEEAGSTSFGNDTHLQSHSYTATINRSPAHQRVTEATEEVIKGYEYLPSSSELTAPEIQKQISEKVLKIIMPAQGALELEPDKAPAMVTEVVERVTKHFAASTIDIPNIVLIPSRDVTYGFHDFDLAELGRLNFRPVSQEILIRQLRTSKSSLLSWDGGYEQEERLENYIVRGLIDHEFVDYDAHADFLYKLAEQVVGRFKSYLSDESDVENVLVHNQGKITDFIVAQLKQHCWETPTDFQVSVDRGFTVLKPYEFTIQEGAEPQGFRSIPEVKSQVRKIIFTGFKKCCYPLQKFDSVDGELRFAHILEDDACVMRWMKPAPGSFRIDYKNGSSYEPDFVVETVDAKYLCEPKRASEMQNDAVLAKKTAAVRWCKHATEHAQENGGKPWHYALIPHNEITSNRSFDGLVKECIQS
ncbi:MAG: DEAD/DEAH box helicase [Parvibaculales bacterium]